MCGIAGILNIKVQTKELRDKALKMAQKIRHRGPDWSGIYVGGSAILAHERLSIVEMCIRDSIDAFAQCAHLPRNPGRIGSGKRTGHQTSIHYRIYGNGNCRPEVIPDPEKNRK